MYVCMYDVYICVCVCQKQKNKHMTSEPEQPKIEFDVKKLIRSTQLFFFWRDCINMD